MPVEITEVFYPETRKAWRRWLERHHLEKSEIWLQRYHKASGKPSVSYDELVEECLCFGWIDGITKKYDSESSVQRVTPRRKRSNLSEMNRQRIWKLQHLGLMTEAGIAPIADQLGSPDDPFEIPKWIAEGLKSEPGAWEQFLDFPLFYQRLKVGWLSDISQSGQTEIIAKRLDHLVKTTAAGKRYGTEPLDGIEL